MYNFYNTEIIMIYIAIYIYIMVDDVSNSKCR